MSSVGRLALTLFALPTPTIAPPPRDDDVLITCDGGMTIVPITDPDEFLDSPQDARLTLSGQPVRLDDPTQKAGAECDRLVYTAKTGRIELIGSASQPLLMTAPRLTAGGKLFWLDRTAGGFTGPGWLDTFEAPDDREGPAPDDAGGPAQLQVRWTEGLDLAFAKPAEDGAMGTLRSATFRGDVTTADAERTMWADRLGVAFGTGGGSREIESIDAAGDIQILLTDGTRVFADRLAGDAAAETIELTGENVALARDVWLVDQGRRIVLDRATNSADWPGAGVGRRFSTPLALGADRRLPRPVLDDEPEARVQWSGSMRFDQSANEGAGAIELHGGVEAVSQPTPLERSTFNAQNVTLALADDDDGGGTGRRLGRIIARGDARMERRDWTQPDRSDDPRIFSLWGERIEYDDRTGEGLVPGAGELLLRDVRADDDAAGETDVAFGARGTTSFRWREKLQITRREVGGTIYDVTMTDGIEMRHLGPGGQVATMTCDRVAAAIDRAEAESGDGTTATDPISGPAELIHLRAEGTVFLHTAERDVECGVCDYDVRSGLAELIAPPGGFVSVMTAGTPHPVRMERATWDLKRDEVTIVRTAGGGPR